MGGALIEITIGSLVSGFPKDQVLGNVIVDWFVAFWKVAPEFVRDTSVAAIHRYSFVHLPQSKKKSPKMKDEIYLEHKTVEGLFVSK